MDKVIKGVTRLSPWDGEPVVHNDISTIATLRAQLFLVVPFDQSPRVKNLGARWDKERRAWYVPHGMDLTPFEPWWPATLKADMRKAAKAHGKDASKRPSKKR